VDQIYKEADPVAIAQQFAATHTLSGFRLDFSIGSLETEVDRLLESPLFCRGRERLETDEERRNLAALCAYVGETLRQLFGGEWGGQFYPQGDNFYTSFVQFGNYRYWPGHFISYRLANWPMEGTFAQHLERLLPAIQARVSK